MGAEGRFSGGAGYAVAAHEAADGAVCAEAVEAVAQVGVVVVEPVDLGGGGLVPAAEELELLLLAGDDALPFLVYPAGVLEPCGGLLLGDEEEGDESSGAGGGGYELYDEVGCHGRGVSGKSPAPAFFDAGAGLSCRGLRCGGVDRHVEHLSGLLSRGGVDEEVLHEHLWCGLSGLAEEGGVVAEDVEGGVDDLAYTSDLDCLGVGVGDAVGLGCGGHDDELQSGDVRGDGGKLEGECSFGKFYGGFRRCLHSCELGRVGEGLSSAADDPEVEAGVEVGAGDLRCRPEDAASLLGCGHGGPCEDLLVGQAPPAL